MQVIVKTTTQCNLACTYCSEGNQPPRTLSLSTFCKLIDELPPVLERAGQHDINILWHGGEPLLWGIDRLEAGMTYAEQKLSDYKLHFTMQSNGYRLDDDILALLQRHRVHVGISLDGRQAYHDAVRRTKDGKPTWSVVWQHVQQLHETGLGGGILMVYRGGEDAQELFDFLVKSQVPCKINPLLPCGRAASQSDECQTIYGQYVAFLEELYRLVMASDSTIVINPLDELMDAILQGSSVCECSYNGHCGQSMICLYADGAVGFCGRDSEKKDFAYGNLEKNSLLDLYESGRATEVRQRDEWLHQHDCRDCDVFNLCHGGCTFEAFNDTGCLTARFPYCKGRRDLLHFLRTEGMKLLKTRLLRQKRKYRMIIRKKEELRKEMSARAR